jgi:hypothetical protein
MDNPEKVEEKPVEGALTADGKVTVKDGIVSFRIETLADVIRVLPLFQADNKVLAKGLIDLHERLARVELKLGIKRKPQKGELLVPDRNITT